MAVSAAALAAALLLPPLPANAGDVESIAPAAISSDMAMPSQKATAGRTWTQIVWDNETNRLERRTYKLLDPLGAHGYDLAWDGDAASRASDGPLTGEGTLTWREAGSPAYDTTARVATYSGEMKNGRPEGKGTYTHRSGVSYSGQWHDGLMHGQGRLFLPNGDQYSGGFALGKSDGDGIYIDATGTIYQGRFAAGMRDGDGSLYPATGEPFTANWRAGKAVTATIRYLKPAEQLYPPVLWAQYQTYDDIRVGVLVDRTYYAHLPEPGESPVPYAAENLREQIAIRPDSKRIVDAWRGTGNIAMTEDEEFEYASSELGWKNGEDIPLGPGFLSTAARIRPVPVIVELRNDSDQPLRIVNAFLDVEKSASDLEPMVQMRIGYLGDCGTLAEFKADFDIDNFGWGPAENATLRFTLPNDPSREFSKPIGTIERTVHVDLSDEVRSTGYPVDEFKAAPLTCTREDFEDCFKEFKAADRFAPFSESVKFHVTHIRAPVSGTLDYEWRDASGTVHKKSSPFSIDIVLGRLQFEAECGEGGTPEDRQLKPFDLALDKQNYRIMIPLRDDIPPGVTGRWRVRLQAPKSSTHDFRVVFELADGRQVASRPVDMEFFKPWTPDAQ
ncbi:MAG: hypothetical protein KDJ62_00115 [Rhodobiaceae bacterium]|nr:hypothetical protein [Rhodobiaceae bacterium]MCC0049930.1 hypothetical protein [Rhodobiaceae bacterium]